MNVAYVRVSTVEQNEERQIAALRGYGIDRWFVEKTSGKDTNRAEFRNMLGFVREGDCVFVEDFSRLTRNLKDLLETIERLDEKGVKFVSVKEQLDTSTNSGKLILQLIGAINEFERRNILERQREGIECAKQRGVYKGRKPKELDVEVFEMVRLKKISVAEAGRKCGCSRATIYNHLKNS